MTASSPPAQMTDKDTLVSARGLSVRLGGTEALRDVDFSLRAGEIVTVVGPNGSGKTTFLRLILGALKPDRGRVIRRAGLRVGYAPQRLALDPTLPLTVDRFLRLAGTTRAPARGEALARVGAAGLERRQIATLSGGQRQRVLLARALLRRPHMLALDEPTQALDQNGGADFYALIAELRAELNCAVLMVSHDLHVVMSASDRVICLNGHICCQGAPMTVSEAPEYRRLFGDGAHGALALYRHHHDHRHDDPQMAAPAMPGAPH